ncbi:hypothetical protein CC79DRAFT_1369697 [Sarocladium strictum]
MAIPERAIMKSTMIISAVAALLLSSALAAPVAEPIAEPQVCTCVLGCYDTCGAKLCC